MRPRDQPHGVERVSKAPVALGPSRREPSKVRRPSNNAAELIVSSSLNLVALVTTVDREDPPTVLVVLPATTIAAA